MWDAESGQRVKVRSSTNQQMNVMNVTDPDGLCVCLIVCAPQKLSYHDHAVQALAFSTTSTLLVSVGMSPIFRSVMCHSFV